jgi:hypothetical protein
MKLILALALTICLFACKEEVVALVSPGLVGTYSKTYTMTDRGIFQDILPEYNSFQETTTAIVSQTGTDTYAINIQIMGVAKKNNANPLNYYLTAEVSTDKSFQPSDASKMSFVGEYSSLYPTSPYLPDKKIWVNVKFKAGVSADMIISTNYREDHGVFLLNTLPKIK